MTNEEMQKAIQFLLDHHAQFAVELERLQENTEKLQDAMIGVIGIVGRLAEAQARTESSVAEMADAQARADARISKLAEKGGETEERLNVLIGVVERYIGDRRNGRRRKLRKPRKKG